MIGFVRPLWLLDHRAAITAPEPLAAILGVSVNSAVRFGGALVLWLGGYAAAVAWSRRALSAWARRLLFLFPLLFAATLLFVLPVSSQDVYHYIMEGRILAVYGENPALVPPSAHPLDPLYATLSAWQNDPSPYGPLFNLIAGGVAWLARDSLIPGVIGFKLLAVAALFGTAALAQITAARQRPATALPAYVLIAWNPLALYEAGANAHNSLLMALFIALALDLAARRRWELALPALALGALTKYVAVLLVPVLLIAAIGEREPFEQRMRLIGLVPRSAWRGLALAALLVIAFYAPFWGGPRTFTAAGTAADFMISSPGWLLRWALKPWLGWAGAGLVVMALLTICFLLGYALILARFAWRALDHAPPAAPGRPWGNTLWVTCWLVLVWQLVTISWGLWPWYVLWLLPPAALLAGRRAALLTMVITGAALAAYVPINFREAFWGAGPTDGMSVTAALTMMLPPLALAGALLLYGRARKPRRNDSDTP